MPNLYDPDFVTLQRPAIVQRTDAQARRAQVGAALGTERLGASVWEIPPGEDAYPYHFHFGSEEVLVVVEGRPSLRTEHGTSELEPGDVAAFPIGTAGAHQVTNESDERVVVLALSELPGAEVVVYPELASLAAADMRRGGTDMRRFLAAEDLPAPTPDPGRSRANLYDLTFDERREHPGFVARRARLGYQLGMQRLGLSAWELPPGETAYPYHFHFGEEELLIVLEGRPLVRTPDGWARLARGDMKAFPIGEAGAHQLVNDTGEPVCFLAVSSPATADVVVYPDEGKICAADRRGTGEGLKLYFTMDAAVDYHVGVRPPEVPDVDPA
jgi:uncharacterized cupin superfamily protein